MRSSGSMLDLLPETLAVLLAFDDRCTASVDWCIAWLSLALYISLALAVNRLNRSSRYSSALLFAASRALAASSRCFSFFWMSSLCFWTRSAPGTVKVKLHSGQISVLPASDSLDFNCAEQRLQEYANEYCPSTPFFISTFIGITMNKQSLRH